MRRKSSGGLALKTGEYEKKRGGICLSLDGCQW